MTTDILRLFWCNKCIMESPLDSEERKEWIRIKRDMERRLHGQMQTA